MVGFGLPLRLVGGLPVLGRTPCSAEVVLSFVVEVLGDDMGVDVRPPDASETKFEAHWTIEFLNDPVGILVSL